MKDLDTTSEASILSYMLHKWQIVLRTAPFCLIGLAIAGCQHTSSPSSAPTLPSMPPGLVQMGQSSSAFSYKLDSLPSCRVGDAVTVLANAGASDARVRQVIVDVSGDRPGIERRAISFLALKAGTTTGELAPSFELTALGKGTVQPGQDAVLRPVRKSGLWYVLIARLQVIGPHPRPWTVSGIIVTYRLKNRQYNTTFRQSVNLPAISTCNI